MGIIPAKIDDDKPECLILKFHLKKRGCIFTVWSCKDVCYISNKDELDAAIDHVNKINSKFRNKYNVGFSGGIDLTGSYQGIRFNRQGNDIDSIIAALDNLQKTLSNRQRC